MRTIKTVLGEIQNVVEIRRSKFITSLKGGVNSEEAEAFVKKIKARYPDATHNCFAYKSTDSANDNVEVMRASDDGEPFGTAGQPMLEVLKKRGLTDVAVVVTRYFGGIKLGAGGLIGAYTRSVAEILGEADLIEKTECAVYEVKCGYQYLSPLTKTLSSLGRVTPVYGEAASLRVKAPRECEKQVLSVIAETTSDSVKAEYVGTDCIVTHILK